MFDKKEMVDWKNKPILIKDDYNQEKRTPKTAAAQHLNRVMTVPTWQQMLVTN